MSDSLPDIDAADWNQSIYDQLHLSAEKALQGECPGHSLQPTLLVNDAYRRLRDQQNSNPDSRLLMLTAGATVVRRLLVE